MKGAVAGFKVPTNKPVELPEATHVSGEENDPEEVWLLVDGDVACYHGLPYDRASMPSQIGTFDHELQMVKYSEAEDAEYLSIGFGRMKRRLEDLVETYFCDGMMVAVKGPTNYRDDIHPMYKKHPGRVASKSNSYLGEFVPLLRLLAVDEGLAVTADGMEADDYLRIWAEKLRAEGKDFIVASVDKDLYCIPGKHLNLKTNKIRVITETEALVLFYKQMLTGDQVDNIPGAPGVGPKTADKLLDGVEDETEMQIVVSEVYFNKFGDKWREKLLFNGKLLYLLKTFDDEFTLNDWTTFEDFL